mgnify:CR=1 FL=1
MCVVAVESVFVAVSVVAAVSVAVRGRALLLVLLVCCVCAGWAAQACAEPRTLRAAAEGCWRWGGKPGSTAAAAAAAAAADDDDDGGGDGVGPDDCAGETDSHGQSHQQDHGQQSCSLSAETPMLQAPDPHAHLQT